MLTESERASKGAVLLDTQKSGWERSINVKTLDMGNPNCCVLSQVFGVEFKTAISHLELDKVFDKDERYELGFISGNNSADQKLSYQLLTLEWLKEISNRM